MLRGIAVIAMCFDHLMCDFVYLPGWFSNYKQINNSFIVQMVEFAKTYWNSDFRFWAHYIFVFLFLFLVGTSCAFSRDNTRRGALLFVVAFVFTGGTLIMKQVGVLDDGIYFGILDCIALSILIAAALDTATKPFKEFNVFLPLVLGVGVIAAGIGCKFWVHTGIYDKSFDITHIVDYVFGSRAYGDDWFPIFPYVGAVLCGLYWGKAVYSTRNSLLPMLDGAWNKPFRFVGRHALIAYIVHQGVLSGIVMLVCSCLGYTF